MAQTSTRIRRHLGTWPYEDNTTSARAARRRLRAAPVPDRLRAGHARTIWGRSLVQVGMQADTLTAAAGDQALGASDLVFVATLGEHIARCRECWAGPVGMRPVDHLTWAVRQRPAVWEVFGPVLADQQASRAVGPRWGRG